jgi:hypothetical protein
LVTLISALCSWLDKYVMPLLIASATWESVDRYSSFCRHNAIITFSLSHYLLTSMLLCYLVVWCATGSIPLMTIINISLEHSCVSYRNKYSTYIDNEFWYVDIF